MSLTTLTPPASEPVSLAAAKLFLRVDHDEEDALITRLIGAAREAVEHGAGRALVTRRVRETLDVWRRDVGNGALLSLSPVTNIVAVRLIADNGSQSVLDPASYRLDGARDRPRLVFEHGLPTVLRSTGGVEIDYDAGLAANPVDLAPALVQACLHIIAALYEAREGGAGMPEAARVLMRPYAPARL